jgi:hypothetical protein
MKLQILASPPADDRPRRAMAVWPTHLKADPKADPRRVTLVLHLACEQGAWHVESVALDEGAGFARAFKEANPGAGPVQSGFDGRMAIEAVVTAVGEKTLTVRPVNSWQSAPRPAERTFALDAGTGVFVPEYSRDQELPGGRTFPVYKAVPGGRDDLKVGQRVFVEWPPGEARAARVSISAHANENGRR